MASNGPNAGGNQGLEDVDDELLPDGYGAPSIIETFVGAWKEALSAEGYDRIVLVALMLVLTFAASGFVILPALWILRALGVIG